MTKKTEKNPRGAGRKPNSWIVRRVSCPEPILDEVKKLIKEWERKNK